jgi:murein DD-endopeptidase MepM/ murein hydrolase activator NlpD
VRAFPPHRQRRDRWSAITAAAVLVVGALIAPAAADTLSSKLKNAGEELTAATKEVLKARKTLASTQAKLPGARAQLWAAQSAEVAARGIYTQANADAALARQAYNDALQRVADKQAEIDKLQVEVNQFARAVYQQGQASQWEIILEAQTPADLTARIQTIKSVAQASANSLTDLGEAKAQLAVEATNAAETKKSMQAAAGKAKVALAAASEAKAKATAAKAAVDELIAQQSAALKVAERDRAVVKRRYDLLKAEQLRLQNATRGGSRGNGDPQATGPLSWPLPGYSPGGSVGWRVHPIYRYRSCHTGVDVGAPLGTRIRAAGTAIVLSTGWSTAYGNVTLLDHGDGLVTMYAHQSKILVSKGQVVTDGAVIGLVGSTGFSTGPHLHFEVHINGVPYDPMGWFGRSKVVVPCWGQ